MSNPSDIEADIQNRRAVVLNDIALAAKSVGRSPNEITLTAVSKVQPDHRIDAMLATGQCVFGENRVQEAQGRWTHRRRLFPDLQLRLIGPLQTNKAEDAVALFDVIETLDRPKLAREIAKSIEKLGRGPKLLVQINTGEESQKSGISPKNADDFIQSLVSDYGLHVSGVMCIPPAQEPPGPHFALLKKIADRNGLPETSAGMSQDFVTAIRFGATHVRVGSALFGERNYPA